MGPEQGNPFAYSVERTRDKQKPAPHLPTACPRPVLEPGLLGCWELDKRNENNIFAVLKEVPVQGEANEQKVQCSVGSARRELPKVMTAQRRRPTLRKDCLG